jgi:DNA mismatch repair protein MutS
MPQTLEEMHANPAAQTPMMRQFLSAKASHPDAIVFFRMGDFYETFFDDAVDAARLLDLTLTSRNKKDADPIPMAGVPHHAAKGYIRRLLLAGRKVAVCEQVEDPKLAKGIVERRVVQIVTPGVVLDTDALDRGARNYLAAIHRSSDETYYLALVDASTGHRRTFQLENIHQVLDELERADATELLVGDDAALKRHLTQESTRVPITHFPMDGSGGPETADTMLESYLASTQMNTTLALQPRQRCERLDTMGLGAATVRNLELIRCAADGQRKHSLLGLLDKTRTAMGARLLKEWLLYPLVDMARISGRHEAVGSLVDDVIIRDSLREQLDGVRDLERLLTRIVAARATPREVAALADSLERLPSLIAELAAHQTEILQAHAKELDPVEDATKIIRTALIEEPPANLNDGGVIREGFHTELDELIVIAREGKAWFQAYAAKLKEDTGISSLKVRYNHVFGYFIEVTRANLHRVPETWLRKQTLSNAERYITPELKEREEKVLGADERRVALEGQIFEALRAELAAFAGRIQSTAARIAEIDVLQSLAEVAALRQFVRPELHEGSELSLENGRHPVIETLLESGKFVPNDIEIDTESRQIMMITGPNMAGKSTVMRQTALIVIMAQMGSFVPASRARIGLVDQVFTRVGASDNITGGQSTFMVEMVEAARILHAATKRSLVIIDEIGRGTSTYDGVSIAWAVAEFLHDAIGARTLFATHYHELIELASAKPRIANMTIAVKEWNEEIVFLHRLIPGGTNRSYGIQVARLAGLPEKVLARARIILGQLEASALDKESWPALADKEQKHDGGGWQLNLFSTDPRWLKLKQRLAAIHPDELSPREAHNLVYELKSYMKEES